MRVRRKYYCAFVCAALLFVVSVFCVAFATPQNLTTFFISVTIGVTSACLVEVFSEVVRVGLGRQDTQGQEKMLAFVGLGYRIGALFIKLGMVAFAVAFMWRNAFCLAAGVLVALIWLTRPLSSLLDCAAEPVPTKLRQAFGALHRKKGLWVFVFPLAVPFADTFVRSMLGAFLLDQGFSLTHVGLCYGFLHGAGMVGSVAFVAFFPHINIYGRLSVAYTLNVVALGALGALFFTPHVWVLCLWALVAGVTQGLFLQVLRLILGQLSEATYVVEHMAIFYALWALGSVCSAASGWVSDVFGWLFFLLFSLMMAFIGLLAIYFMWKTSDNAL